MMSDAAGKSKPGVPHALSIDTGEPCGRSEHGAIWRVPAPGCLTV